MFKTLYPTSKIPSKQYGIAIQLVLLEKKSKLGLILFLVDEMFKVFKFIKIEWAGQES